MATCLIEGSARGCAKLASMMANNGGCVISEKAWNEMHAEPKQALLMELPGIIFFQLLIHKSKNRQKWKFQIF